MKKKQTTTHGMPTLGRDRAHNSVFPTAKTHKNLQVSHESNHA